ncbi:MAG: hypothetical protein WCF44_08210 [Candidatus Methylophosphatis roskildensis]|nr:hypothetical protein [Sterolibacteriaceae bacterium]MBK9085955.1 hypothetical protein [Sterolibacteriaceae bacterium]
MTVDRWRELSMDPSHFDVVRHHPTGERATHPPERTIECAQLLIPG